MRPARDDVVAKIAEVFRQYGYEGASLGRITEATGLGKGSLYHLFPQGKEQMAREVLDQVRGWFEREIFRPLEAGSGDVEQMFDAVLRYFASGRRICLAGLFALEGVTAFEAEIRGYFARWCLVLGGVLGDMGLAEEIVGGIQGALVLAHGLGDFGVFERALEGMRRRV